MDRATTFTLPGVPDFVIAMDHGWVVWIEAKSRTGKQTTEQRGFEMMLTNKGHNYYVVRSMSEFLEAVRITLSKSNPVPGVFPSTQSTPIPAANPDK